MKEYLHMLDVHIFVLDPRLHDIVVFIEGADVCFLLDRYHITL